MAQTVQLKDALEIAKQNPEGPFATQLRRAIENGQLDEAAAKQGVDLTRFGRPAPAPQGILSGIEFGIPTTAPEPASAIGATGNTTTAVEQASGAPLANRVTDALGLGGATQVFGDLLARQSIGTDVPKEVTQEFIEAPTGREIVGAALQTAAIPAGFVLTGGTSVAGQAAMGAALGYAYDVGADLIEGSSTAQTLTPGVGTLVGAGAPLAIAGAGKLFNMAYGGATQQAISQALPESGVAQAVKQTPVPGATQQTVEDVAMRGTRAVRRGQEFVESQAAKAARIAAAPEPVKQAIRANVDDVVVDLVQNADPQTRNIMREMVEMAEAPKTGRAVPNPTAKAGDVAVDQYTTVTKARQAIGKQIGELSDSLPVAQNIDNTPAIAQLDDTLRANDIQLGADGNLQFNNLSFTPQQQQAIQELYDVATSRQTLSAKQIHQLDQLFSAMQRQKQLVDNVGSIYIDTPNGKENIFATFRNIYRTRLDDIAPEFRELNKQYAQYTNMVESIEGSLIKSKDFSDLIAPDGGVYAEAGLRRMFGEGVNAQANADLYNALDTVSRANGYAGPRADELYYFGNKLRDIYPETIPETGLRKNISTSIRDVVSDVFDIGTATPQDQQEAIKALLELN